MLTVYQIDAFTDQKFKGNPAAVCPLEDWPSDGELQSIANELNLSETAFLVAGDEADFHLRWFTPHSEVRLCGHATLATAHVLFNELGFDKDVVRFTTEKAGILSVRKDHSKYTLDFPADSCRSHTPKNLNLLVDQKILESYEGSDDLLILLENEKAVKDCVPNIHEIKRLEHRAVIVTSESEEYDFVSRVFAPNVGIDEDPVTGSAHTLLSVFWSNRLGSSKMKAAQISTRRGELECELDDDRVFITGSAITVLKGELL